MGRKRHRVYSLRSMLNGSLLPGENASELSAEGDSATSFPWRLRLSWELILRVPPWLRSSQYFYFERLESCIRPSLQILDIGCGKEFLMSWLRPDLYRRWTTSILERALIFGIDPYLPSLQQNASR